MKLVHCYCYSVAMLKFCEIVDYLKISDFHLSHFSLRWKIRKWWHLKCWMCNVITLEPLHLNYHLGMIVDYRYALTVMWAIFCAENFTIGDYKISLNLPLLILTWNMYRQIIFRSARSLILYKLGSTATMNIPTECVPVQFSCQLQLFIFY